MQNQTGQQREHEDYEEVYKQSTQHQSQDKGFWGKDFRHILVTFDGNTVGSHTSIAVVDEFSTPRFQVKLF